MSGPFDPEIDEDGTETSALEGDNGSAGDDDDNLLLRPPQSISSQIKRNAFLEGELEKLLDDIDRYEVKLDEAEKEIESLLFQKKKLEFQLDSVGFRRTEFETMKRELEDARSKIVHQQQLLDEQEQQIEEQDQIIKCLEEEINEKKTPSDPNNANPENEETPRQRKISEGRKSAYEINLSRKDMKIAMLEAELEDYKKSARERNGDEDGTAASANPELKAAMDRMDGLEKEKEELAVTIAVLNDHVKELQEKVKLSAAKEKELEEKISAASEKTHEWKRRAEIAEKRSNKGQNFAHTSLSTFSNCGSDDDGSNEAENEDAPQALLLQSAISRKLETTSKPWGLGAVFGGSARNSASTGSLFGSSSHNNEKRQTTTRGLFSSAGPTPTIDDSDIECIKQVNRSLKEANAKLRSDLDRLEKAHKKEQAFNQKLILKLQKDNEKIRKPDGGKPAPRSSGSKGNRSSVTQD